MAVIMTPRRHPEDEVISVHIPYPPTANNLFFNKSGRGRVKTERYRTWLRAAGNELLVQRPPKLTGKVVLSISLGRPDRRKRDLSNCIKPIEDLLVAHGLIEDDSLVERLSICWAVTSGAHVLVWPLRATTGARAA